MDRMRIRGGRPLEGEIEISGAKNAALKLMTASLLTDQTLTLTNLPRLADIDTLLQLLEQHGVESEMNGGGEGMSSSRPDMRTGRRRSLSSTAWAASTSPPRSRPTPTFPSATTG